MNGRQFKIVLITPAHLNQKERLQQPITNAGKEFKVDSFSYQSTDTIFPPNLVQANADCNAMFVFFDPTNSDSRKAIPHLLDSVSNKAAIWLVPYVERSQDITDECKFLVKNYFEKNSKALGVNAMDKPICFSSATNAVVYSVNSFVEKIKSQARNISKEDDEFGSVDSPDDQNTVASAAVASASVPLSVPSGAPTPGIPRNMPSNLQFSPELKKLLTDSVSQLNQSIASAEKERHHREEFINYENIKRHSDALVNAYHANNEKEFNQSLHQLSLAVDDLKDGRGNLKKFILGAALCVLGIGLLIASIPLYLFAPPAAILGTAIAMNVLAAGLAAVTGLSLAIGFGIFTSKQINHGVVKEGNQVVSVGYKLQPIQPSN